jgi:hypothetical protein
MLDCCAYCVLCCVGGFKAMDRVFSSKVFGKLLANIILPGIVILETYFYFTQLLPSIRRAFGDFHSAWITTFGLFMLVNITVAIIMAQYMGKFNYAGLKAENDENECSKCGAMRPDLLRIHHCSTCNRCILRQDHHCRKFF